MVDTALLLAKKINFNVAGISFSSSYMQAGLIIFLVFVLLMVVAKLRRHLLDWSFKGAIFGIFWGFVLALVLEGFLVLSGRTAFTEIIGWKNAPKPILNVLDLGRNKLAQVLGSSIKIPDSEAQIMKTSSQLIKDFQNLAPQEAKRVKSMICAP